MWTRGRLRRYHVPAPVPHVPNPLPPGVIPAGAVIFAPPPLITAMDPSDKRTWRRPVRWT